jgi:hypothetical protein
MFGFLICRFLICLGASAPPPMARGPPPNAGNAPPPRGAPPSGMSFLQRFFMS